jgi:antitoxin component YwqK of YwqJK toxin-antitoxin module
MGKMDGYGKEFGEGGVCDFEGGFKGGRRQGFGRVYYDSGKLKYQGLFDGDLLNDTKVEWFYENGGLWLVSDF